MPLVKLLAEAKERALIRYLAIDEHIRNDLVDACIWARQTLTDREGEGHVLKVVFHQLLNGYVCTFAKPSWTCEHQGPIMRSAEEAVVMAVCEYLEGL